MRSRPVPPSRSPSARLRVVVWRGRYLLAAVCLGLAGAVAVGELAPPAVPGTAAVVLTSDVEAGRVLTGADVVVRELPGAAVPDRSLAETGSAVGQVLALGLPRGTVVTAGMFAGPGLAEGVGEDSVVVAVPVADAGLLVPGTRVGLFSAAADVAGVRGSAELVARDVVVLAVEEPGEGSLLDPGGTPTAVVHVEADETTAAALVGASAWSPLRAVLRAPPG